MLWWWSYKASFKGHLMASACCWNMSLTSVAITRFVRAPALCRSVHGWKGCGKRERDRGRAFGEEDENSIGGDGEVVGIALLEYWLCRASLPPQSSGDRLYTPTEEHDVSLWDIQNNLFSKSTSLMDSIYLACFGFIWLISWGALLDFVMSIVSDQSAKWC